MSRFRCVPLEAAFFLLFFPKPSRSASTVLENELIAIAEKKSVMMGLVDSTSMSSASVIIPVEEDVDVNLEWLTAYGEEVRRWNSRKPKRWNSRR